MPINARRRTKVALYPPEFNAEFKAAVKRRDKHRCAMCGKRKRKLDIHHIDYTKVTVMANCICLCRDCHSALHMRDWKYKNRMKSHLRGLAAQHELGIW